MRRATFFSHSSIVCVDSGPQKNLSSPCNIVYLVRVVYKGMRVEWTTMWRSISHYVIPFHSNSILNQNTIETTLNVSYTYTRTCPNPTNHQPHPALGRSTPRRTTPTMRTKLQLLLDPDKGVKRSYRKLRKRHYIPPPKPPAPPIPDPLDGMGLARTLPAELVVVLRRLGKKDEVTRRKGLEELKEGWVGEILGGQGDEVERELKETALLSAVPVWVSVHRRVWMRTENISYTTWLVYCNHPSTALWLFSCKQIYLQYPQYGRLYSIVYPYHYYPAPRIVISWDHGSLLPWRKVDEREVSV
jgi:hypothetical protein